MYGEVGAGRRRKKEYERQRLAGGPPWRSSPVSTTAATATAKKSSVNISSGCVDSDATSISGATTSATRRADRPTGIVGVPRGRQTQDHERGHTHTGTDAAAANEWEQRVPLPRVHVQDDEEQNNDERGARLGTRRGQAPEEAVHEDQCQRCQKRSHLDQRHQRIRARPSRDETHSQLVRLKQIHGAACQGRETCCRK